MVIRIVGMRMKLVDSNSHELVEMRRRFKFTQEYIPICEQSSGRPTPYRLTLAAMSDCR